jgi:nucleoside-diphosphate-sugar epimerase
MKLLIFGLGYSARAFMETHARTFTTLAGTVRQDATVRHLKALGLPAIRFDDRMALERAIADAEGLLVSVPPGEAGDPVLAAYGLQLAAVQGVRSIVYLSTIGVYGDHEGAWVDEASDPRPTNARSRDRLAAERAWQTLANRLGARLSVLRLAGIYGPGQNALQALRAGTARRIIKPGQVFNRIHVEDIGRGIAEAFAQGTEGPLNVTDDEPAPPQDVVTYAAALLGLPPPAEVAFDEVMLSPMARSFYAENKRVANGKLKRLLGNGLTYPTYREGLRALYARGEGR